MNADDGPDQQDRERLRGGSRGHCSGRYPGLHRLPERRVELRVVLADRRVHLHGLGEQGDEQARGGQPDEVHDLVQRVSGAVVAGRGDPGQHGLEPVVEHRLQQAQLVAEVPGDGAAADAALSAMSTKLVCRYPFSAKSPAAAATSRRRLSSVVSARRVAMRTI
nr:hypothetical protein GCM10020093_001910 [Planobispora longispora]